MKHKQTSNCNQHYNQRGCCSDVQENIDIYANVGFCRFTTEYANQTIEKRVARISLVAMDDDDDGGSGGDPLRFESNGIEFETFPMKYVLGT